MAPKSGRGGGGGGRHSNSSSCSSSAFASDTQKVYIAFVAFWLLVYLGQAYWVSSRKKKMLGTGYPKESLQWAMITMTIAFTIIAYILVIVSVVLVECNGASITGIRMAAASSWFSWLGLLFLYGLVMVPVCRQLHQAAGCAIAKIVSIAHLGVMTVLSIIIVAFLAVLSSATETAISETVDVEIYSLADANRGLLITFDVLALIGMIMASVSMCLATTRTERFQKGSLALWIGLLIGGCLATSSFNLGGDISRLFTISTHRNTASRLLSTVFVGSFFYAWLFACVLLVVTSPALVAARAEVNARTTDGTSAPAADASSAPDFELKDSYSSPADQKAPQSYLQQQQQPAPPPPQTHH